VNQFETITPIQRWSLPAWIGFKRIAGRGSQRFAFTLAAPRSCSRPSAMNVGQLDCTRRTQLSFATCPPMAEIHQPYFTPTRSVRCSASRAVPHLARALRTLPTE
jgi:hypothetical protein